MSNSSDIIPNPTCQKANVIRAIQKSAVHRICSGQVVLSLAVAVKELVENSLDAGATSIDIRLTEYGSKLIEVIDNGSGVNEIDFQALTLKHHTSKLRDFTDLPLVSTFGFRGEALSSLCALGDVSVLTRHGDATSATRLKFNHEGGIASRCPCARQVGTTVSVGNLFASVPVRQKEFQRNLRREFAKMTQLLYAYCLVATKVKIMCSNLTGRSPRSTVVTTHGSATIRDNIVSVFGCKQLQSLLDVEQSDTCRVYGHISTCQHGCGRSAADRQFYYINSRPCELTKLSRLVNEVYRSFNAQQHPFVWLNVETDRAGVDVNVTPDKRQVFLNQEATLLDTVKTTLLELFQNIPATFQLQNVARPLYQHSGSSSLSNFRNMKRPSEDSTSRQDNPKQPCISEFLHRGKTLSVPRKPTNDMQDERQSSSICLLMSHDKDCTLQATKGSTGKDDDDMVAASTAEQARQADCKRHVQVEHADKDDDIAAEQAKQADCKRHVQVEHADKDDDIAAEQARQADCKRHVQVEHADKDDNDIVVLNLEDDTREEVINKEERRSNRRSVFLNITLDDIRAGLKRREEEKSKKRQREMLVRFRAGMDPSGNQSAEQEMSREISKAMFVQMEIVGQFNLGFIVTRLNNDLFIIDQHAADEKYNFETLQRSEQLHDQPLVRPRNLQLSAVAENVLLDNMEVMTRNGFTFTVDMTAPTCSKIKLTSIPISRGWEFGTEDIDELLFMLQDSPGTMCRPSRVRAMFASRACRKSVMIGTALNKSAMRRIVDNLGTLDQPWNCPHGRPTMRHLINLDLLQAPSSQRYDTY